MISINKETSMTETALIDTVEVLIHRLEFLQNLEYTAKQCNLLSTQMEELYNYASEELIKIDNLLFTVYAKTEDPQLAWTVWESHMNDFKHWLELMLGIKVKFL